MDLEKAVQLNYNTISQLKTQWQIGVIDKWKMDNGAGPGRGTVVAPTGIGKTMIPIMLIKRLNNSHPEEQYYTDVVVPYKHLKKDWEKPGGHIEKHNLKNVFVWVVNTYCKLRVQRNPYLLALDEVHHEGAATFREVFSVANYKALINLTATLERGDQEHHLITDRAPIIENMSLSQAKKLHLVSDYIIINYGMKLPINDRVKEKELGDTMAGIWSLFNLNWYLLQACARGNNIPSVVFFDSDEISLEHLTEIENRHKKAIVRTGSEWRRWYASERGWNGREDHICAPKSLQRQANIYLECLRERETLLHTHQGKIELVREIRKVLPEKRMIVFSQRQQFADMLAEKISDCMAYHSKVKSEIRIDGAELLGEGQQKTIARGEMVLVGRKKATRFRIIDEEIQKKLEDRFYEYKELKKVIPKCYKISSEKVREEAKDKFESGEIKTLSAVEALDEGFNVEGLEVAIIAGGTSVKRQDIQRTGRALRFVVGKTAYIINLYFEDTQDEKWLKRRQGVISTVTVRNIDALLEVISSIEKKAA